MCNCLPWNDPRPGGADPALVPRLPVRHGADGQAAHPQEPLQALHHPRRAQDPLLGVLCQQVRDADHRDQGVREGVKGGARQRTPTSSSSKPTSTTTAGIRQLSQLQRATRDSRREKTKDESSFRRGSIVGSLLEERLHENLVSSSSCCGSSSSWC